MSNIILLRHGQTAWNVQNRYQGQLNSDLTHLGKAQALNNAQKLKTLELDWNTIKLFSSPLGRAQQTAQILAKELGKKEIIYDKRLAEFSYGLFQGKTRQECARDYPDILKAREANKWHYQLPNGESYEIVSKRVVSWFNEIENAKWVIVVAHEMLNRTLRGLYLGLGQEETLALRQPNDQVLLLTDGKELGIA
ncbi:MAG: histidine phosphatase family protein [Campylobacterota bacterium]|nr:histidine phosphatase family protein [Campylobacterota bacterium]